jgi:hypothetical protein
MKGFIKLDRCLLSKEIFLNEKLLKTWIWCLLKATHAEHKERIGKQIITVLPGQFVTGRFVASNELGMAPSTTWDYLKLLEKNQSIAIKSNNKYSLISVVNWAFYQIEKYNSDSYSDNTLTTNGQQIDTNKNGNKGKNDKKSISKDILADFETLWQLYPKKEGKGRVSKTQKEKLAKIGLEEMTRAIERYKQAKAGKDKQYLQNGSTFFNSGYVDYLDANYQIEQKQDPWDLNGAQVPKAWATLKEWMEEGGEE